MSAVRRSGWWGIFLGLGLALSGAASPAAVPETLRFQQFGVEHGLAQANATAILQDRQGFIWFGSQAGLSRYDGYRVIVFLNQPDDPHSLADNWVTALHEDSEGRLWVGTRGGVLRYDAARMAFQRFVAREPASRGTGNRQIRAIVGDSPNVAGDGGTKHIWIATADGLQRLDTKRGTFEVWHHDASSAKSLVNDDVQSLVWDRQGRLWVGTSAGLDRLDAQRQTFEHFRIDSAAELDPKRNSILALRVDSHDTLWVGTPVGLEAWSLSERTPKRQSLGAKVGMTPVPVRSILQDRDGVLWVGTWSGLLRWDADRGRFVRYRHDLRDPFSLVDDQVDSLFQDRSGTLWVGTNSNGTSRVDLGSGGFGRVAGLGGEHGSRDDNKVYAITGDRDGHVWLGTIGGGLQRVDRRSGEVTAFRHDPADPHSLPDDIVRAVRVDAHGQLWVGTRAGIARFDPKAQRFRVRHFADIDPSLDVVRSIRIGRSGVVWIGTEGGLHRYEPGSDSVRTFRHDARDPGSLGQGRVVALLEDRQGTLWAATDTGLDRWDAKTGRFTHFRHDPANPESLSHDRVTHLFEDRAGQLWVGTGGGLNRMENRPDGALRFRSYTHADGLGADPIGAILQDGAGRLWISTTSGLSRFDPAGEKFRNYSAGDGLLVGGYYIGASHATADGIFYFGGLAGLTAFRPETIRDNSVPPPVIITELQVFNRPVLGDQRPDGVRFEGTIHSAKSLRLSHANSVFSLEFAALHYADPERNRYAYQLVGFDPDWIQTDATRRFVTYTNLDPGHYVFRVKAANKDGVWNDTATTLEITIDPPFWATWWFRMLAAAALVASVWALVRYRVREITRQRALLAQEVTARTAEVVQQKEHIEQAHTTLSILGEIGREITATLDESAIFQTLDRHVHALLDATSFAIYLMDEDGRAITSAHFVEQGQQQAVDHIELASPVRVGARCVRERREMAINLAPDTENPSHVPGTMRTLSALFAPLTIGERVLGMMTIQSPRQHAYGEREQVVFRTLCSYGAIALDNAAAYRRLAETDSTVQRMLLEQQLMFDNVAAAVFFIKGRIIHRCNRGMEEMLGYAPGEMIGKSTEIYHPSLESFEALGRQVYPLIATGQVAEGEWEIMRKNGENIWISFRGRALDPHDESQGSIWVAHDITERKRTAAALERALREQKILFDNVLGGIMFTKGRVVVRCNRGLEEILGYEPGELDGKSTRIFYKSDEDYESLFERAIPVLTSGGITQGEIEYVRKDGTILWLVYSGKAVDPNDLSQGVIWSGQDFGAQKQAEAALKQALHEKEIIFDNMTGGMWIANHGIIQRCNRGFEEILGLRPGDGVGMPLRNGYVSEEAYKSFVKQSAPVITAGKVASGEQEYVRSDGDRRWMIYQGKALDANDLSQGTIWFGHDITERKRSETALLGANVRLERGLADVEQLNRQVSLLGELTGFLQACPSAHEAFACIGDFGPRLFPESAGALFLAEETGDTWVEHGHWGGVDSTQTMPADSFLGSECWALRRSRSYRVDIPSDALCCPHVPASDGPHRPYACLPLTAQGKTFGLLYIEHQQILSGAEADRRHGLAVAMAEQIALSIANVQLREALLQQSIRDPLTGLYNRRFLQESLFREMAHSKRNHSKFAVLMIDVDHFKKFNDSFGHHAGDLVLQNVARTIEAQFRRSDIACRFGGEEFTVLLPGTDLELAQRLANGVLEGIRELVLSHENKRLDCITASLGVAIFPDHGGTPEALIEAADAALYQAKEGGRNRVVVCGSSS